MDETMVKQVENLLMALRALVKSAEKAYHSGAMRGTGDLVVRGYHGLHSRASALLADDAFITETLKLETNPDAGDDEKVSQVLLLGSQLIEYLDNLARTDRPIVFALGREVNDLKGLGREIQDQIINLTRQTLRRAITSIDLGTAPEPPVPPPPPGAPPPPPVTGKRIKITLSTDDESDQRKPADTDDLPSDGTPPFQA